MLATRNIAKEEGGTDGSAEEAEEGALLSIHTTRNAARLNI